LEPAVRRQQGHARLPLGAVLLVRSLLYLLSAYPQRTESAPPLFHSLSPS
jgi:hypothetical protein